MGSVSDERTDELWQAILAAPDDDGPRLVYADHLLARGDPQGELITVQCALARSPTPALRVREAELLANREPWLGELAPFVRYAAFARGFIDEIRIGHRELSERDIEVLLISSRAQLCTTLHIRDVVLPSQERAEARIPRALHGTLGRVRRLVVNGISGLGTAWIEALAACGDELVELTLSGNMLGERELLPLAMQSLWQLELLDVSFNHVQVEGLVGFLTGDFPRLAKLEATRAISGIDSRLTVPRPLPSLRDVDLSWCGIGGNGGILRDAAWLSTVHDLDLRGNDITDDALARFLDSPHLGALRKLQLDSNNLTDASIALLAALDYAVTYDNNNFSDAGLTQLDTARRARSPRR